MTDMKTTQVQQRYKVLLIGDSCTDEYQYGTVDRISPEAPVPIFNYLYSEEKSGMVFNVKANLEKYPIDVTMMTDLPSRKIRLIDIKTKQHVIRIDKDRHSKDPLTFATAIPSSYDAIVVCDYNKGFITYELLEELHKLYDGPIFVDTKKKDLARIKGCIVKVNEQERNDCTSLCSGLIVTMGSKGALYDGVMYESTPVEIADVCGAGDTFLAALTYFQLVTNRLDLAIPLANKAAAVTVQHIGTYAPEMKEFICG